MAETTFVEREFPWEKIGSFARHDPFAIVWCYFAKGPAESIRVARSEWALAILFWIFAVANVATFWFAAHTPVKTTSPELETAQEREVR